MQTKHPLRFLECEFGSNSIPKASSRGEGCSSLIYSNLAFIFSRYGTWAFPNNNKTSYLNISVAQSLRLWSVSIFKFQMCNMIQVKTYRGPDITKNELQAENA